MQNFKKQFPAPPMTVNDGIEDSPARNDRSTPTDAFPLEKDAAFSDGASAAKDVGKFGEQAPNKSDSDTGKTVSAICEDEKKSGASGHDTAADTPATVSTHTQPHMHKETRTAPAPHLPGGTLRRMIFTAAMVAISVVLCRFLGFSPQNSAYRFDLGFLPIALVAQALGPIYAGAAYFLSDLIGCFVHGYAPNPWISLCNITSGALMGIFFHKKHTTVTRTLLAFFTVNLLVSFLGMTPVFIFIYAYPPAAAFGARAINAAVTYPVRVVTYFFVSLATEKPLIRFADDCDKFDKNRRTTSSFQKYANSFQSVTVPGLSRITALLSLFGDPQDSLRCIHIAGTNGKGSVSAYIASSLSAAGYRVGKYISPNLLKINERISVNGVDIDDNSLSSLLSEIEPKAAIVKKNTGMAPTQFEIWTAAAFLWFAKQKCDYVVLEVGLGGEFDATNVIKKNEIAVITRLGMDHMQYLGNTLAKIAAAKCGILKDNSASGTCVTVEQEPEAMAVIRRETEKHRLTLLTVHPQPEGHTDIYEHFSVDELHGLTAGIPGYHQIENAALAAVACKTLGLPEEAIRAGIASAVNPGRFERLSEDPTVIYDGGHNENGIRALVASLNRYYPGVQKTVVFACMTDKKIDESLRLLSDNTADFIFTTVKDNPRAMTAEVLTEKALTFGICGTCCPDIGEAYEKALRLSRLTVICGSLYLYHDLMDYLSQKPQKT